MPRERYLLGMDEEPIHSNVITEYSRKDKVQNWWWYNKRKLLAGIIAVAMVASLVCSIVFKVKPDYTIAIMSGAYLDEQAMTIMENHIASYGEDLNGDGKVIVSLQHYAVGSDSGDAGYDVSAQQAAATKFAADMTLGESMIWLHDPVGYYCMEDSEDLFTPIQTDISLKDPLLIPWADVKAFQTVDFAGYENEVLRPENMVKMFSTLRVSFRKMEGSTIERKSSQRTYHEESEKLLYNLINDSKPEPKVQPAQE